MDARIAELAAKAAFILFDYQLEFLQAAVAMADPQRVCLYYKTGAGKSFTALASVALWGYDACVVVCPPSTHAQWAELGEKLGVHVTTMSHARFRMKDTKLSRSVPVIADEFHLFGGQKGQGWRKLDTLARHLKAPLVLASATPNYNDAERCYCIQHVLDPLSCKGGYLQFIYQNCETEQNPFGMEPKVVGFLKHASAAEYLADLPNVFYLPDDLVVDVKDIEYHPVYSHELELGYNRRKHRMIASIMEMSHTLRYQGLVSEVDDCLHTDVYVEVERVLARTPKTTLVYANHATVAQALARTFDRMGIEYAIITGATTQYRKDRILREVRAGRHHVLIGTASLATGTDGLDRVCDTLLILDDTDDDALRRQLIGRIMPRGDFVSVVDKQVFRLTPT